MASMDSTEPQASPFLEKLGYYLEAAGWMDPKRRSQGGSSFDSGDGGNQWWKTPANVPSFDSAADSVGTQAGQDATAAAGGPSWISQGLEKAAPWLTGAYGASVAAGAAKGYRTGGATGAMLNVAGKSSPQALQAAQQAAQAGRSTQGAFRAASAAEKAQQAAQVAGKAPGWTARNLPYLSKVTGGAGKTLGKFLPGVNVASSAYTMYDDAKNLFSGKDTEAPTSGWGLTGDMAMGAAQPLADLQAGFTAGGPVGALAAVGGRAALNVANVGKSLYQTGQAFADKAESEKGVQRAEQRLQESNARRAAKKAPQAPATTPKGPSGENQVGHTNQ